MTTNQCLLPPKALTVWQRDQKDAQVATTTRRGEPLYTSYLGHTSLLFGRAQEGLVPIGKQLVSLGIDRSRDPKTGGPGDWLGTSLRLRDLNYGMRAALRVRNDEVSLYLGDADGMPRLTLGNSQLVTTRTGAIEKRPLSSIVGFDKKGQVTWARQ